MFFSKFDVLFRTINQLHEENLYFGATCVQECWLQEDYDISLIQFTNYKLIQQSKVYCGHGGLIIYQQLTWHSQTHAAGNPTYHNTQNKVIPS